MDSGNWGGTMRNIKFRGKRVTNGEWVYGFYYTFPPICRIRHWLVQLNHYGDVDIVPETVGQFIGLKDKNGKEIYEGDIVKAWSQGVSAIGEVSRRIDGLWIIYPAYQKQTIWGLMPDKDGTTTVEVIGNIYDNPELVEPNENY